MRADIKVVGIVQGVGFRPFIYRIAVNNDLKGTVQNKGDAGVEIILEGDKKNIEIFLKKLREKKPPLARIYDVDVKYNKESGLFEEFKILKSTEKGSTKGSVVPPDVSICEDCINEMKDRSDRRYGYFFTTCTNCGPRFTTINSLPYDRHNTTMNAFPMCDSCRREYEDVSDRRFHAQTVACYDCGPKAYLVNKYGENIDSLEPIREAGKLIDEGFIVALKGNGGFHIATATTIDKPIAYLRKVKHRRQKPFALMAKDLESIRSFAKISLVEEALLTSHIMPIVLLDKSEEYYLSDIIAPGLHNIGVMLPYTGLHLLLFYRSKEPAFIMTSGNPPNEPIVKNNIEALKRLGDVADYFLLHNREIAYRCDDSVVRYHRRKSRLIRRSRGYAPAPIQLSQAVDRCVLGVGGDMNVTGCVVQGNQAFLSQHIGDVELLETFLFYEESLEHLIRLTNSPVEVVACDLHPKFMSTKYAEKRHREEGFDLLRIQHHYAHLASLIGEHGVKDIIGIICDGVGFGADGNIWGGEIMYYDSGEMIRATHLELQPMPGGDLATKFPLRMVAGILNNNPRVDEWLLSKEKLFPYREKEVEVVLKQARDSRTHMTSSCGRVLDAVSALLGICYERTYEGEPAMKLESAARGGKEVLNLKPEIKKGIIQTTNLISEVFSNLGKYSISDIAFSVEAYLAKSLGTSAVNLARELDFKHIGLSGGVAYNEHIAEEVKRVVQKEGLIFLANEQVPCGDGGVSFGQAVAAGLLK